MKRDLATRTAGLQSALSFLPVRVRTWNTAPQGIKLQRADENDMEEFTQKKKSDSDSKQLRPLLCSPAGHSGSEQGQGHGPGGAAFAGWEQSAAQAAKPPRPPQPKADGSQAQLPSSSAC